METNQRFKNLGLSLLILTLTFFVSMNIVPEFNQVFAGTNRHIIIHDGNLDSAGGKFTMKARGTEYFTHSTSTGDWNADDKGDTLYLSGLWVKYIFKVPAYMYDNKLITKFTVKVKYHDADSGCSETWPWPLDNTGKDCDDRPSKLYCYNRQDKKWDGWDSFSDIGSTPQWVEQGPTSDLYPGDPHYHIGDSGGEKYQIHIKIDAPDGAGSASSDDDAEIHIDEVQVVLYFHEHVPGNVINSGTLNNETYTMKAKGKDVWRVMPGEIAGEIPREGDLYPFRINEGWVRYAFEVPHEMLDHRLIQKLRVKVKYDNADWANPNYKLGRGEPPKLYVYRFDEKKYFKWKDFPETGDGVYQEIDNSTYNIYTGTNDEHQYIGFEGESKYRIYVKIYAPGGAGWRNDDDANIDIDEVQVVLELNYPHVPKVTLVSPDKIGGKVNVPVDSTRNVTFSVKAEDVGLPVREYQWQEQLANEPAPSFLDTLDDKTTDSKKNYAL